MPFHPLPPPIQEGTVVGSGTIFPPWFSLFLDCGWPAREPQRFRAGREVVGGGGGGEGGGGWRGVLGSRLSPDCTIRFIHFSKAVLTKFSSSSSSSTATPLPPGPSAPGSCLRRLVASRSARESSWVCCTALGGVQTRIG